MPRTRKIVAHGHGGAYAMTTTAARALVLLSRAPGGVMTMGEIAAGLGGRGPAGVRPAVSFLEARGLVVAVSRRAVDGGTLAPARHLTGAGEDCLEALASGEWRYASGGGGLPGPFPGTAPSEAPRSKGAV